MKTFKTYLDEQVNKEDVAVAAPTNVTGPQSGTDPVSATAVKPRSKRRLFITKRNPPKM